MREQMIYDPRYYQLREEQLERMLAIVRGNRDAEPGGVVFFGDSLTQFYPIERCFPELRPAYNCGIGGATTGELMWIVDEAVIKYRPRLVVLMVGTNDLGNTVMTSPAEIAWQVKELAGLICGNLPDARVLLWSPLPCIEEEQGYRAVPGIRSNDFLKMVFAQEQAIIREPQVTMLDVFPAFVDADGRTRRDLYRDGLHVNDAGYDLLTELLAPEVHRLLR